MVWKLGGWTLFTTGFGAGLWLVVYRAAHGVGTVGDLVLAITVAVTLRDSVQHTLFYVSMALSGHTVAEPYLWLRDYAEAERRPAARPAPATLRDGITLDRVTFTVTGADRILVLDRGRLMEQGRHDELLAGAGRYADLYRIQADAYGQDG